LPRPENGQADGVAATPGLLRRCRSAVRGRAERGQTDDGDDASRSLLSGTQKGAMFALACVLALDAADRTALGALAPALKAEFSIGNGAIGLLASAFSIVGGLATIPMGVLTDRTRRVTLLVVSIAIWSVAMGVAAAATTFAMLFVARIALGVVTAAGGPPVTSIVGDLFSADVRGRVLGWVKSGEVIGAGAGFLIAGALMPFFSWRSVFVVLGAFGVLLAFRVARIEEPPRGLDEHTGDETGDDESRLHELIENADVEPKDELVLHGDQSDVPLATALGYVVHVRALVMIIAAGAFGEFFFAALQVFGVLFLVEQFDIAASTASLLIVAVGAAGFVGVVGGGRLGDRLIRNGIITGRIQVGSWSYLAVAVLFVPVLLASSLAVALPFLVVAGVFLMAPVAPLEAARIDVVNPQLRGRAESARTLARVVAQSAAPLLFGLMSDQLAGGGAEGLQAAFFVFLPLLAVSSVLLAAAARQYPSEVASVQVSTMTESDPP
jgi:predicted MFS family arabinose efflux permease